MFKSKQCYGSYVMVNTGYYWRIIAEIFDKAVTQLMVTVAHRMDPVKLIFLTKNTHTSRDLWTRDAKINRNGLVC